MLELAGFEIDKRTFITYAVVLKRLLRDFSVDAWKDFLSNKFPDHFEWRKEIWRGYEDNRFELFKPQEGSKREAQRRLSLKKQEL